MKTASIFKRISAFALTMALLCTMVLSAAATDPTNYIIDTDKTGSLIFHKYDQNTNGTGFGNTGTGNQDDTVQGDKGNPVEGASFAYVKVADIVTYQDNTTNPASVQLLYRIAADDDILGIEPFDTADEVEIKQGTLADGKYTPANLLNDAAVTADDINNYVYFTADTLNTAITNALTGTNKAVFKKNLEDYLVANGDAEVVTTGNDGTVTADDLDLGLYLVAETAIPMNVTNTTDPFFVSIPMTNSVGQTATQWIYDVHVYPKNQTDLPTIDKLVKDDKNAKTNAADDVQYADTCTASKGDVLDYAIVIKIPDTNNNDATGAGAIKYFIVSDTLSNGLTVDADSVAVKIVNSTLVDKTNTGYKAAVNTLIGSAGTTWAADNYTARTTDHSVVITATDDGRKDLATAANDGKYMVITYQATVNQNDTVVLGDVGNRNDANLLLIRNNMDLDGDGSIDTITPVTDPDTGVVIGVTYTDDDTGVTELYVTDVNFPGVDDAAKVYTYELDLTKLLEGINGNNANYEDVQFSLYNDDDGYFVQAVKAADATGGKTANTYYVNGAASTADDTAQTVKTNAPTGNAILTVNQNGALKISGLEAGNYTLTEIKTANGYSLLKDPISIVITPTSQTIVPGSLTAPNAHTAKNETATPTSAAATVNGVANTMSNSGLSNNAILPLQVTNLKNAFTLPQTGGAGSIVFTALGAVVFGATVIFLRKSKKKED